MIDTDQLDDQFGIEGEIGFMEMDGDLVFANISNKYADADICLYGAHVTSFRPVRTMEMLFMSPETNYEEGKAIRGGIPVCFPWFGPHKTNSSLPQHGFGRLMYWDVLGTKSLPNGETQLDLISKSSEATKAYWPHDFEAIMHFTVGAQLTVSLEVRNTSAETFTYGCALHSYFVISDIAHIGIEGLQGLSYLNQLTDTMGKQEEAILKIEEPLTRHYQNTESAVVLADEGYRRRIRIEKAGSKVTTVWNPGAEASAAMSDMPDDGFASFVCIEATASFDYQIELAPGASFQTTQIFGVEE